MTAESAAAAPPPLSATAVGPRTVADAVVIALRRNGVDVMFGQSIPTQIHLAGPRYGIRSITYRTENAGGAMADGYARISHKVAVVTAQNGPAATLLVPPLAEALQASVPVLALVQDVARDTTDRNAFQELDHIALFKACSKWVRRADRASRIDDYIDMAFVAAASGRPGPAVLLLPMDLLDDSVRAVTREHHCSLGSFPLDRVVADPTRITTAAELLTGAQRPLVIAGGGVHISGAAAALSSLQEQCGLPVATTIMGKGAVDERHPLSMGVVGSNMGRNSRTRHLRSFIEGADVILLIGNRTNQNGTDSWTLIPRTARVVHLDADPQEVGRNYDSLRLVGDAALTLQELSKSVSRCDLAKRRETRLQFEEQIRTAHRRHAQEVERLVTSAQRPIRPERIMADLDKVLKSDSIIAADASYSSVWVTNYLTSRASGMRFLSPRGLAGLGWGLPLALGAKQACPDRDVICVVGDGGFGHCWSELETALRHGLNIPVVVLNNQILGFQKHGEELARGEHTDAVCFKPVDHAAIARACGCYGTTVEAPEEFLPALTLAFQANRPTVLDVVTDPDAYPPITGFDGRPPT